MVGKKRIELQYQLLYLLFLKVKTQFLISKFQFMLKAKEIWDFKYSESIQGIELGDINNDGQIEIIAYTRNGSLLILSLNGTLIHQEIIMKDTPIWHIRIFDIDNDNKNELI